ncbi:hypothetical protein GCM10010399_00970 [Dactylosporangium fulvum]|uniref:multicopper oxidase domain-containing protein n=1 Tax=Dactylosporangium fulvum TaxID=53359 RepID=UPI0031DB87E1
MTTGSLLAADLVIAVLGAAGWLGGGAASAARRRPLALGLAACALLATFARAVTIAALARAGWWFAAEKVLIAAPLSVAAVVVAGPRLLRVPGDIRSITVPLLYGAGAPVPWSRFDREFTLVLDRGLDLRGLLPRYAHTVNGAADPDIPPQVVHLGETVKFTIVNRSLVVHPWHLHGHHVLVLSRDGKPATGSPLWLDSFDVRPGEVWEVAFAADNPGMWANHCHNLAHADAGMTLHLMYS